MCAWARLFYVAVKASNESVPQARQSTRVCLKILSKMEYSPEFTQANTILEEDFQKQTCLPLASVDFGC